ncbi:hypothetical protein, partial [Stenotrophomonas pavanii]|uniref:hypothetical protein n=1 Tax=Stenotrophomonas pavanii TaxID=487698 RepID=UPI0039EE859A
MAWIYGLGRRWVDPGHAWMGIRAKENPLPAQRVSGPAPFVLPASGRRYRVRGAGQRPALPCP